MLHVVGQELRIASALSRERAVKKSISSHGLGLRGGGGGGGGGGVGWIVASIKSPRGRIVRHTLEYVHATQ